MTRPRKLGEGEYYHVLNRGAHKHSVFKEKNDWQRMLFGILYFQSHEQFSKIGRIVHEYSPLTGYPVPEPRFESIEKERAVELTCFCLMSNHLHLLLRERRPGGIAAYMHRVETAYTNYFNIKYQSSGHLFQGRYKAVHVRDNRQLLYLSAYIHRNPREIAEWKGKEDQYPWSSLQDYVTANRWGGLLATDIIADQFGATKNSNYADFVKTSTAKIFAEELESMNLALP